MNAKRKKKTLWMKWKQNVIVLNELNQMVLKGSRIYISHRPCVQCTHHRQRQKGYFLLGSSRGIKKNVSPMWNREQNGTNKIWI